MNIRPLQQQLLAPTIVINAVYEETTVIMNIILELDVTVDEALSSYSTVTKSLDIAPTHTPAQPPAPVMPSLIPAALGNLTASPN